MTQDGREELAMADEGDLDLVPVLNEMLARLRALEEAVPALRASAASAAEMGADLATERLLVQQALADIDARLGEMRAMSSAVWEVVEDGAVTSTKVILRDGRGEISAIVEHQ